MAIDDLQHVAVAAQGPGPLDVVLQLQGDGHSEVMATYTPTVAGLYNVAALCKGQQIKGSSWELEVRPGKGRALHSKVVQLPGSWTAGVAAQVVVDVRDVYGNVSAGGDCVAVEVDNALEGAGMCAFVCCCVFDLLHMRASSLAVCVVACSHFEHSVHVHSLR